MAIVSVGKGLLQQLAELDSKATAIEQVGQGVMAILRRWLGLHDVHQN
jgi:hypothetical protein